MIFYNQPETDLVDATVIYGNYNSQSYEGDAIVIYIKEDKLYFVSGAHCSCNGMDWKPEQVSIKDIEIKLNNFYSSSDDKAAILDAINKTDLYKTATEEELKYLIDKLELNDFIEEQKKDKV